MFRIVDSIYGTSGSGDGRTMIIPFPWARKGKLPPGVQQHGNKFISKIQKNKKQEYLGLFDSPEEAHEAFRRRHIQLHGEDSLYF